MIQIKLSVKPLSVNGAFKGRKFKTPEYSKYEKDLLFLLPKSKTDFSNPLRIEIFFGFSSSGSDIDNPVKPLMDILQKKYGFNDNQVYEMNLRKCKTEKGKEFISIQIDNLLPFDQ